MKIYGGSKPAQTVYVQMRQAIRGRDGRMRVTTTKTITIPNTTIAQVRAVLEKAEQNGKD